MKKIISFICIFGLATGLVFSQAVLKKQARPVLKVKPHIKVVYPNGGESWKIGKFYEIRWQSAVVTGKVLINMLLDSGSIRFVGKVDVKNGKISYKVPEDIKGLHKARIVISQDPKIGRLMDRSDEKFTVVGKIMVKPALINSIRITVPPNDGINYYHNGCYAVMWKSTGTINNISIKLVWRYKDEPPLLFVLASNTENDGRFDITVTPNMPPAKYYKLIVFDADNPNTSDKRTVNIKK